MDEAQLRAVERMLEDVSMTGNLVDAAARRLLDWGARQVEAILRETADAPPEEVAQRLGALRRMLRRFADLAGQVPPELQEKQIEIILAVLAEVNAHAPQ
jgi:hypothetical protein